MAAITDCVELICSIDATTFILVIAILIWCAAAVIIVIRTMYGAFEELCNLQSNPNYKVNLSNILAEFLMLIVLTCLPLLLVVLIALTPVFVCYMIKSSWDSGCSVGENLGTMWRSPPEGGSKPKSQQDEPPSEAQPEKAIEPPFGPFRQKSRPQSKCLSVHLNDMAKGWTMDMDGKLETAGSLFVSRGSECSSGSRGEARWKMIVTSYQQD
ncbi:hypothetical protein PspLS_11095 [Pyricularia sp. CBS 133598]|nr:hypothetical protein PspLS_11095 [Pyricularia sp. CBS 133598]